MKRAVASIVSQCLLALEERLACELIAMVGNRGEQKTSETEAESDPERDTKTDRSI